MNNASTTYSEPITGDIYTRPNYTISYDIYEGFMKSLDEVKEKNVLMNHLPSDVNIASKLFPGYLTDEELQERQYKGRFWDVIDSELYILVDDETLVVVNKKGKTKIFGRDNLPYSLQGRHYYDEY